MIHPDPVSGHCWGTAGPCPGANLKPLPFGDCTTSNTLLQELVYYLLRGEYQDFSPTTVHGL